MEWFDIATNPPPENKDVLGYTDTNRMKVVRYYNGNFDTYLKILYWSELPKPPAKKIAVNEDGKETPIEPVKKKRGRPRKQ